MERTDDSLSSGASTLFHSSMTSPLSAMDEAAEPETQGVGPLTATVLAAMRDARILSSPCSDESPCTSVTPEHAPLPPLVDDRCHPQSCAYVSRSSVKVHPASSYEQGPARPREASATTAMTEVSVLLARLLDKDAGVNEMKQALGWLVRRLLTQQGQLQTLQQQIDLLHRQTGSLCSAMRSGLSCGNLGVASRMIPLSSRWPVNSLRTPVSSPAFDPSSRTLGARHGRFVLKSPSRTCVNTDSTRWKRGGHPTTQDVLEAAHKVLLNEQRFSTPVPRRPPPESWTGRRPGVLIAPVTHGGVGASESVTESTSSSPGGPLSQEHPTECNIKAPTSDTGKPSVSQEDIDRLRETEPSSPNENNLYPLKRQKLSPCELVAECPARAASPEAVTSSPDLVSAGGGQFASLVSHRQSLWAGRAAAALDAVPLRPEALERSAGLPAGVWYDKVERRYVVQCGELTACGRRKRRYFGITRYGEEAARQLAIAARIGVLSAERSARNTTPATAVPLPRSQLSVPSSAPLAESTDRKEVEIKTDENVSNVETPKEPCGPSPSSFEAEPEVAPVRRQSY